jgi:hypothetical protein
VIITARETGVGPLSTSLCVTVGHDFTSPVADILDTPSDLAGPVTPGRGDARNPVAASGVEAGNTSAARGEP